MNAPAIASASALKAPGSADYCDTIMWVAWTIAKHTESFSLTPEGCDGQCPMPATAKSALTRRNRCARQNDNEN